MRRSNRLFLALGAACALQFSACSDGTSGTSDSSVRVSLSGDQSGQFAIVTGEVDGDPFGAIGSNRTVLGHYLVEADGEFPETVEIVAMRPAANGTVDIMIMWAPSQSGVQPMNEFFGLVLAFGVPIGNDGDLDWLAADAAYTIEDGTINMQQVSGSNIQGTFSGTGYEWRSDAELRMLNGTFTINGEGATGLTESLCRIAGKC